uniref:Uncharacterized protein n=1 Tax=Lotharella oceanica TaxID=641309 RepID=A0A7S2X7L0_9EUKA|mmetsp:Transcript_13776/g.26270  ORF Transcript_13776/g.26270 Transcript_13776/m.26270 type:complete len:156 (+) Transcript_13776:64-531(+)
MMHFGECKFSVMKKKKGSARVVFWRELRLWNSFTMEASFCGSSSGPTKGCHYKINHYEQMGKHFCETIYDWISPDQQPTLRAIQDVTKILSGLDRDSRSSATNTRRKKKTHGVKAVVRVPTKLNRRSNKGGGGSGKKFLKRTGSNYSRKRGGANH